MSDPDRPTQRHCALINTDIERPFPGQRVLALTVNGVLVNTVWREVDSHDYDAWMPFPDVPYSVKEKQSQRTLKVLKKV